MNPLRICLLLLLTLTACGPDPSGSAATPETASVAIMGQRTTDESNPDVPPEVEAFPACMGVAVSSDLVLTSDHCPEGMIDGRHIIVDYTTWYTTARGSQFADSTLVSGEIRSLVPRTPLSNWVSLGSVSDAPAEIVVIRGSDFVTLSVTVLGYQLTDAMLSHGDSGAGVFQMGKLVGIVQACNSSNDTDCDLPGGRFRQVAPLWP